MKLYPKIIPAIAAYVRALQLSRRYDIVHAFTHHLNVLLPALLGSWMGRGAPVLRIHASGPGGTLYVSSSESKRSLDR